jgi:hypothetical protein
MCRGHVNIPIPSIHKDIKRLLEKFKNKKIREIIKNSKQMYMKRIILFLAVLLAVGCSKKEGIIEDEVEGEVWCVKMLKEYGLDNMFDYSMYNDRLSYASPVKIFNDSIIIFGGNLIGRDKVGMIGFNSNTKEKIFDLVIFDDVEINKPYGEKVVVSIDLIGAEKLIDNGVGKYALLLNASGSPERITYLFVIGEGKIIEKYEIPNTQGAAQVEKWGRNFIFLFRDMDDRSSFIYHPSGDTTELSGVTLGNIPLSSISEDEILNDFEAIFITGNVVKKIDLRRIDGGNLRELWLSMIDLSKLDRPRIDSKALIEKTDTHFTYEINYTEYSGSKGVIKFKVNIETGNVEYL